jgi:hypothetical protein
MQYIEDVTVFCVWIGKKYGVEYVKRLGKAICNDPAPFHRLTLRCITDNVPEGTKLGPWTAVAAIPMAGEEGCWPKLQCFHPIFNLGAKGRPARNLYLDLDVVVTGELDGYFPNDKQTWFGAMKDSDGKINSSVMSWYGNSMEHIWQARQQYARTKQPFGKPNGPWRGDQNFIRDNLKIEWKPLDGVVSYKNGLPDNSIPARCRVAVFHGKPKMSDLPAGSPYRLVWER